MSREVLLHASRLRHHEVVVRHIGSSLERQREVMEVQPQQLPLCG